MSELQLHHRKEPRNQYLGTEDCRDIVDLDASNGTDSEVDISMLIPGARTLLEKRLKKQDMQQRSMK